jgi:hypothetical protein
MKEILKSRTKNFAISVLKQLKPLELELESPMFQIN